MIFPYFNNVKCDGEDYSSPSIVDILRWISYQPINDKYIVNDPSDIFNKIVLDSKGNLLDSRNIILNKHLYRVISKFENINRTKKINFNSYFKYGGEISIRDKSYKLFYTKKVLKRNMALSLSDDAFNIWKDDIFHIKKNNISVDSVKKCQIKIWP